jgi:hypothetical protein
VTAGKLIAPVVVLLVVVFALITSSIVSARKPFPAAVTRSFDARVTPTATATAVAAPLGCDKRSTDFYDCQVVVSAGSPAPVFVRTYRLWLRDDGCWTATLGQSGETPAAPPIQGCIEE